MNNFVIYFDQLTDSLDITHFISSNQNLISSQKIIIDDYILKFVNFRELTAIFLFGLFTSLCAYTFCCSSKKSSAKYIIVEQEPVNDKIIGV